MFFFVKYQHAGIRSPTGNNTHTVVALLGSVHVHNQVGHIFGANLGHSLKTQSGQYTEVRLEPKWVRHTYE